jgi:predicted transcriptional regulator
MADKRSRTLTPLELEVMTILWEVGPATVGTVHKRIQRVRPLAYNTVQTVLTILHRKGRVKRVTRQRAYVYSPVVSREKTAVRALRDVIDRLFGGRPEALVLSMVRSRQLTAAQLAELQRMVAEDTKDKDEDEDGSR